MATLLELPEDVIHSVAELLPVDDFFLLRLSCWRLNAMSLHAFIRVYFQTCYHLLEMDDEQSRDFFAFLEAGWGRGYPCEEEFEEEFEDESDEDLEMEEDDKEDFCDRVYRERLDDQKTLLPGHDIIYLAEVGSELSRGFHPDNVEDEQLVQRILQVMLSAVAKSELPVEKLDFYLGYVDEPKSVNPISPQLLDWPVYNNHACGWEKRAMGFFDLFLQLLHFTLAFDDEFDNHTVFPIFSELLKIPQLRVMELARFEATAAELTKMLLRHQSTLEEITLREVKMNEAGSWTSVLSTQCLIGDWFFMDVSDEIDEVVSIKDRERIEELAAQIEIVSAEMAAK
ncbi:uncharacterized protein FOBCDRAFT_227460 [Fusarium oxysporum Fo47]|uniref:uncharacterized protein n=1 Tax=Fusarium oxysporum Fo47 TaxID=660027 RepID=UPI002869843D|nr:uncharacterized protein FOBCDRAFT_227460 [Fusarium oxysporum Fo47]QKD56943.2 hypothetical protein FOBCDRAFT_227460 [Fusarium oxysporum Fo47]